MASKKRVLFLEHDHTSPPDQVAERFAELGYEVEERVIVAEENYYSPNVSFDFPDPQDYDVLVPMGSPWGAWDDERIGSWLLPEIDWLRAADAAGVPVLGLCFGGQLLARVHGGQVSRAQDCEIGWSMVWSDRPDIVDNGPWFQFHYDRWWTLPPGATEIARNSRASQAFTLRRNLGVQFHPELTPSMLQLWIDCDGRALIEADGQDPDILLEHVVAVADTSRERAHRLVDGFLAHVATTPR